MRQRREGKGTSTVWIRTPSGDVRHGRIGDGVAVNASQHGHCCLH